MEHYFMKNIRGMRQVISTFIVLCLLLVPYVSSVQAADGPVSFSLGNVTGHPGDIVSIPVSLNSSNINVTSFTLKFSYDSSILEPQAIHLVTEVPEVLILDSFIDNTNLFNVIGGFWEDPVKKGELFTLNFRIKGEAAYTKTNVGISLAKYEGESGTTTLPPAGSGTVNVTPRPQTVKVGVGTAAGIAGGEVNVPISIMEASAPVAAYGMQLDYDADSLKVEKITGSSGAQFDSVFNNEEGYLRTFWVDSTGGDHAVSVGSILYTVTFKIKEDATPGEKALTVRNQNQLQNLTFVDSQVVEMIKTVLPGKVSVLPEGPLTLSAVPGNAQVKLSWTPVEGATEYTIYQNNSPFEVGDPKATQIALVQAPGTTYQISELQNGTTYYFIVESNNSFENKIQSNRIAVAPDDMTPSKLQTIMNDINEMLINMKESPEKTSFQAVAMGLQNNINALNNEAQQVNDIASYNIFYQKMSQTGSALMQLKTDIMAYTLEGLKTWVSQLEGSQTALLAQITGLNNQITGLETQVTNLSTANGNLANLITQLNLLVTDLQTQITALNKTIEDLQNENQTLKQEKAALELKVSTLETTVTNLETKIETLEGDKTGLQTQITTLNNEIMSLKEQITNLTSDNADWAVKVANLNQSITTLQQSLNEFDGFVKDIFALQINYAAGDAADHVSQNITLPVTAANGTAITWHSSNEQFIRINGSAAEITRPAYTEGDVLVTLTSTLKLGTLDGVLTHLVRVIKAEPTHQEAVVLDKQQLEVKYSIGDTIHSVTNSVYLAVYGNNGTSISWTSSHPEIIAENGNVTRPGYTENNVLVTLTALITRGEAIESKTFVMNVIKQVQTTQEAVDVAREALEIGYAPGETQDAVKSALTLASSGSDGTIISWTSNAPQTVSPTGTVVRSSASSGNQTVTLTATIEKAGIVAIKNFNVTVKAFESGKPNQLTTEGTGLGIQRDASGIRVTVKVDRRDTEKQPQKSVVVFQLMKGTEAIHIITFEKDGLISEKATAGFFKMDGNDTQYWVKIFVYDELSTDLTTAPTSLADPIELR
jgi:predicted  nucleic acid-binding Zn-ribbon protein